MLISVPADVAGALTVEVIAARALVEGRMSWLNYHTPNVRCASCTLGGTVDVDAHCAIRQLEAATLLGIGDVGV
jgi:hypothetical protein